MVDNNNDGTPDANLTLRCLDESGSISSLTIYGNKSGHYRSILVYFQPVLW